MSAIRGHGTKIEIAVCSELTKKRLKFQQNVKTLPGTPDIAFPKLRLAIFVHGCFWHGHQRCNEYRAPKTRTGYWVNKISKNRKRDQRNTRLLRKSGWSVFHFWECEIEADICRVADRIENILKKRKIFLKN